MRVGAEHRAAEPTANDKSHKLYDNLHKLYDNISHLSYMIAKLSQKGKVPDNLETN